MALMHSDGLHHWYGEGVYWANNWVNESKQEFGMPSASLACHTIISVPKGKPVTIGDVACPVCREVLLLTTFIALGK